jgi:hypothetical protein
MIAPVPDHRSRVGLLAIALAFYVSLPAFLAHAQTRPRADNYQIPADVQPAGGGEAAKSTNFVLDDTLGEPAIGFGRSTNYDLNAGYRQAAQDTYVAVGCTDTVTIPAITFSGQATGSGTCVVTTDSEAGYQLSWRGGTQNTNGLVAHWALDETTGTTSYDFSGHGNQGVHQNTPTISDDVPTHYASTRSLDFNGSTQYVSVTNDPILTPRDAITLSAWIRPDTVATDRDFLSNFGNTSGNYGYNLRVFSSRVVFDISTTGSDDQWLQTGQILSAGTWYHVAATYDGTNQKIYVNGRLEIAEPASGRIFPTTNDLAIGRTAFSGGRYFDGKVDDVRIYDRALSYAEVQSLAAKTPPQSLTLSGSQVTHIPPFSYPSTGGLLGHWRMDEPAAGTVADSSGYDKDGTPNGTSGGNNKPQPSTTVPTGTVHRNHRSLDFDGTDDYVSVTDTFDPVAYAISAWVRADTIQSQGIFVRTDSNGPATNWSHQLRMAGNGTFVHYLYDGAGRTVTGSTVASAGSWYHVVATVQNSGMMRLYVNGVEEGTPVSIGTLWTGGDRYYVGSNSGGGAGYFDGKIDDVRLYDKALTGAEIKALYGTPQTWTVAATSKAWAGRLRSSSTDADSKWGTDGSSDAWLAIGDGDYPLVTRSTSNHPSGSTEIVQFRAEIGAGVTQRSGRYVGTVVVTATAL